MPPLRQLAINLGYYVSPVSSHGIGQAYDWSPKPTMMSEKFESEAAAWRDLEKHLEQKLNEARGIIAVAEELGL